MYLGIDLGTSSVKIVLMDEEQNILAQAVRKLSVSRPKPLYSEQDPKDWWEATDQAAKELQKQKEMSQVRAIGLSGQMHGATLLDNKDQILRPSILWDDGRSFEQCKQLQSAVANYGEITGNRMSPGFTAPKLLWVAQNEPEIFQKTAKVLLPKDYLRWKMTGEYASDLSDASGTCWLNVKERRWSKKMLDATSLSEEHMPKVFEGNAITGTVRKSLAEDWKIPKDTVVVAGAGDNAASAISIGVIREGVSFLSLGTSGVYFVSCNSFKPNIEGGVHTMCHCLPKLWHQMTVHLSSASCLSWWQHTTKQTDLQTLIEEAENEKPPSYPLIFLPYLSGERTPHNDPYARGVFFGLSHATKRSDLTRAVLEGVAFAFADGQDAMLDADVSIQEVSVIGGGAKNYYWGKILASILQKPLEYREHGSIGAAFGAAKLAWIGSNPDKSTDDFILPPIQKVIEPDNHLYEQLKEKQLLFRKLYKQLQGLYQEAFTK